MTHTSWFSTVLLFSLLPSLAACGGGDDNNGRHSRNGGAQTGNGDCCGDAPGDGGNVNADIIPVACGGITPDVTVTMQNLTFSPQTASIENGDFVRWTNNDTVPHTVTSGVPGGANAGSAFDSGTLGIGESVCFQFNTVATYTYFCQIHPQQMRDAVVSVRLSGGDDNNDDNNDDDNDDNDDNSGPG